MIEDMWKNYMKKRPVGGTDDDEMIEQYAFVWGILSLIHGLIEKSLMMGLPKYYYDPLIEPYVKELKEKYPAEVEQFYPKPPESYR